MFTGIHKLSFSDGTKRYVNIAGESSKNKRDYFILEDGEEIDVGKLTYISSDSRLWQIYPEGVFVEIDSEGIQELIETCIGYGPFTITLAADVTADALKTLSEARDSLQDELDVSQTILRDTQADLKAAEAKVAQLEKEVVNLKKAATKPAKAEAKKDERVPEEPTKE